MTLKKSRFGWLSTIARTGIGAWIVRASRGSHLCAEIFGSAFRRGFADPDKDGTSAPVVIFQARAHAHGHSWWDLAVPPGTPASDWLREVDALLESRPRWGGRARRAFISYRDHIATFQQ